MWVKICANTNLEDAQMAVSAGADALGFVFAPSPRQVTPGQVAAITRELPEHVERYGVFVHPSFAQVVEIVEEAGLSGVQLHATDDPALATRLREHFSAIEGRRRLGLVQVLHFAGTDGRFEGQLRELQADHSTDAVLIDSRTATAQGGTGLRFDWAGASGSFLRAAPHLRLIVAGGLSPENVGEAIAMLRPWGVDVVTGVEATPGRKDPAKVRAFVERARATACALAAPASLRA
jgi:phosphoribosylanthranilate isomerase